MQETVRIINYTRSDTTPPSPATSVITRHTPQSRSLTLSHPLPPLYLLWHPASLSQSLRCHTPSISPPPWQLLGPKPHLFDIATDFAPGACADAFPDFKAEGEALDSLRKTLTVDSLMQFTDIDPVTNSCRLSDEVRISQIAGYHDARTGKTHPKQVLIEDAETGIQVRFSFLCGTYIIVPPVPTAPSARSESLPKRKKLLQCLGPTC